MLKLTMGECLNRHYVRTKIHEGKGFSCVDLTWIDLSSKWIAPTDNMQPNLDDDYSRH